MPELYFIVSPEEESVARTWGYPLAHMAYRMGRDTLQLSTDHLSLTTQGGWMVLSDRQIPSLGNPEAFARQLREECRRRRYTAVLANFKQPADDRIYDILCAIVAAGLPLIVPVVYAESFPEAQVLVEGAISGGNLQDYFEEQCQQWPGRICLSLRPLCMRFPLPSESTEGETINGKELENLLLQHQSFFSHELGCRYCTQQTENTFHFILFDDADSIRYKLRLADQLGIQTVVGRYSELMPFLPL